MGLLLGLGIPLLYVLAIGGFLPYFNKGLRARCNSCQAQRSYPYGCTRDHEFAGFFMALAWPVGLVNHFVSNQIDGPSRTEKRHAKELAEAEHKAKVAELQAKETRNLEIANGIVEASPERVESARRALGEEYSFNGGYTGDKDFRDMLLDSVERRRARDKNRNRR